MQGNRVDIPNAASRLGVVGLGVEGRALGVVRCRVDAPDDPLEVLASLRGQRYLVALIGNWHSGAPVLAWDPLELLDADQDPFAAFDAMAHWAPPGRGGGFGGGWIGALGYQLGTLVEDPGIAPPRPAPLPAHRLAFYDQVLLRRDGQWWLEQLTGLLDPHVEAARAARMLQTVSRLRPPAPGAFALGAFTSTPSEDAHADGVAGVRSAIADGDLFQANLTLRLDATFAGDPLDVFLQGYRALRPAYGAYLGWPGAEVASFSPELFLRRRGRTVLTSPIKGTTPLAAPTQVLVDSVKDLAENVMIVDLMRNDLARVCEPGSVTVPALGRVEDHAVRHLVSDVIGQLRAGVGDGQILRETFPPGSVTGAPKVAALRLINDLEPTARELYTGAIGYVSPAADLELSVAIRTFEHAPGRVWLGVGGGITTLSDPAAEVRECRDKAEPLLAAIGGRWANSLGTDSAGSRSQGARRRPTPQGSPHVVVRGSRVPPRQSVRQVRRALRSGAADAARILVVDNYDSFVHNIVDYLRQVGASAVAVRHDALTLHDVQALRDAHDLTHLLLSPGPAAPADAGIGIALVRELGPRTPILGVCLGHQIIGAAFGGSIVAAQRIVHGRAEPITHDGLGVLAALPDRPVVARYHSLSVDPGRLPPDLVATSWAADGELMGVRHRRHPHIEGLQWHPESILTTNGLAVLERFSHSRIRHPRLTS